MSRRKSKSETESESESESMSTSKSKHTSTAAQLPPALGRRPLLLGLVGLPTSVGLRAWVGLPALITLPTLMSACGASLLPKPAAAPARFTLDDGVSAPPAPAAPAGAPVLIVAQPRAAPGCDDRHMVYLRSAGQLQAYAYHEWLDTPAQMLAPLMVRALQASAAFGAVLQAPSSGSGTLRLETDLMRLQQDFSATPSRLRLTLRAVLIETAGRRVLGWREFDEQVASTREDAEGGVLAARQATRRVLSDLAAFAAALAAPGRRP
jgi:cholesterol transport system auxiliary component